MARGQGRARSTVWIWRAVAVMLMMSCERVWATTHEVGGGSTWNIPTAANGANYTEWSASTKFFAGDFLHFTYAKGAHNVQPMPDAASYTTCNMSAINSSLLVDDGSTTIALPTAGGYWIICSLIGHCEAGMKVTVNVLAANTSSPAASPAATEMAPAPAPLTSQPAASPPLVVGSFAAVVLQAAALVTFLLIVDSL